MTRPLILYHADCADGFCSAWVAWRHFKGEADFLPVRYGQDAPDVRGRRVYVLDFSYKADVMLALITSAESLFLLDHHKTAAQELAVLSEILPAEVGRRLVFDLSKSGGRLAWEFFFPGAPSPWLVDYTEDRDLWRWKLQQSREVSAFVASHPFDFPLWDRWAIAAPCPAGQTGHWSRMVNDGDAILRYQAQQVAAICSAAREAEMDGHKILVANTSVLFSEVAGKLAESRPFGACWFVRGDGKKQWSLRSRDGGVDVSEVARRHGGGGHRNAAGFEEPAV